MQVAINIRLYEYWHEQVNFQWDDDDVRFVLDRKKFYVTLF